MADGLNNARALRILEILNDFRTLTIHTNSHINSYGTPPDAQSARLPGYMLLRQMQSEVQRAQSTPSSEIRPGDIPVTEEQKVKLQSIILDSSARRFRAHSCYLKTACAVRWVTLRRQVLQGRQQGDKLSEKDAQAMNSIDTRLRTELTGITDAHVYTQLRTADNNKGYWMQEDPTLARIQAYRQGSSMSSTMTNAMAADATTDIKAPLSTVEMVEVADRPLLAVEAQEE